MAIRRLLGVLAVVAAGLAPAALARPLEALPADQPVARVGDRVITAGELLAELIQRSGRAALSDAVADRQLEAWCAELGIAVPDEEIDDTIDALRATLGDERYEQMLTASGGEAEKRRSIRRELLFAQWVGKRADPSEERLQDLYREAGVQLREAQAHGILVGDENEARDLLDGVLTADNFGSLAGDYSLDEASRDRQGDLGPLNELNWPAGPEEFEAFLAAEPGAVVGPYACPEGRWLLLRGETLPGRPATFDEAREMLTEQAREMELGRLRSRWRREVRADRPAVRLALGRLYELAGGPPPPVWVSPGEPAPSGDAAPADAEGEGAGQ